MDPLTCHQTALRSFDEWQYKYGPEANRLEIQLAGMPEHAEERTEVVARLAWLAKYKAWMDSLGRWRASITGGV
ncbi:MAG TPA: hypothetical protein PKE29_13415 [Phycisphaerales bacterium]|nr:hypothetical protein [Phycisphaerales bacterium]